MIITGQIEQIFAVAVALEQNGNMKNTIYAIEDQIYILNYDHTVLLRFRLRKSENPFKHPISFKANDYDSNEFFEENDKIVFLSQQNGYQRKKVCGKTENTPEDIRELFKGFLKEKGERTAVNIHKNVLALLDEDLSHVEFTSTEKDGLKMTQRNIYSGGLTEVTETSSGLLGKSIEIDFGPFGIKTGDLRALFSFQDNLSFEFPADSEDYLIARSVDSNKRDMVAVISLCLYDELIKITQNKVNTKKSGRKK